MCGIIDEDDFVLKSPRAIDEGPFDSITTAMGAAGEWLKMGTRNVSIVRVTIDAEQFDLDKLDD